MRRVVAQFMASLLVCLPALAVEIDASAAEAAQCQAEGGCVLITHKALKSLASDFYDSGYTQCKTDVRNRT